MPLELALSVFLCTAATGTGWSELATVDGVLVETRTLGEDTWIRGTTTLDVEFDQFKAELIALKRFPKWIDTLKTWKVTKRNASDALVYGRHDLPWPLADRDYLVRYTWSGGDEADPIFQMKSLSVPTKRAGFEGVVRLAKVDSRWRLERAGKRTKVTYTYNGDIGSDVPRWALESAWKSEAPKLLHRLEADLRKLKTVKP